MSRDEYTYVLEEKAQKMLEWPQDYFLVVLAEPRSEPCEKSVNCP